MAWRVPHGGAEHPAHLQKGRLRVSQLCALMEPVPGASPPGFPASPATSISSSGLGSRLRKNLTAMQGRWAAPAPAAPSEGLPGPHACKGLRETRYSRGIQSRDAGPEARGGAASPTLTHPSGPGSGAHPPHKHNPGSPGVTCPFASRKLTNTQNLRLVCVHQPRTFYLKHTHIPALAKERFLAENTGK